MMFMLGNPLPLPMYCSPLLELFSRFETGTLHKLPESNVCRLYDNLPVRGT